jgi:glycosyltransferase involved in cell wall biosynthesis
MRIVVATVKALFVRGGAELLASSLHRELEKAGHDVELVEIPFFWNPPEKIVDHMLACRLLDLTQASGSKVDLLIALKFPAFYIEHPNKVAWILHQHRQAYDLWDNPQAGDLRRQPGGAEVRKAIEDADRNLIPRSRKIFGISQNVVSRLQRYCGIQASVLYHPPPSAESFQGGEAQDYLFFPSRLNPLKRQRLVIEALRHTGKRVRVRFAGVPESQGHLEELKNLSHQLGVAGRVQWLGGISEDDKVAQYAGCIGVVYPPVDEDYGYVTLEAMLSSKPVITCSDSGGPREFVLSGRTGMVVSPTPKEVGHALDSLCDDRALAARMGSAGRARYNEFQICWKHAVRALTE